MIRVYFIAAALAGLLATGGWLYWKGGQDTNIKRDLERARDHIETRERIDNATTDNRDADAIRDRLRRLAE